MKLDRLCTQLAVEHPISGREPFKYLVRFEKLTVNRSAFDFHLASAETGSGLELIEARHGFSLWPVMYSRDTHSLAFSVGVVSSLTNL